MMWWCLQTQGTDWSEEEEKPDISTLNPSLHDQLSLSEHSAVYTRPMSNSMTSSLGPTAPKRSRREDLSTATPPDMMLDAADVAATAASSDALLSPGRPALPGANNATKSFCEMLYHQLMGFPREDDREMLQFDIHSLVMQYKRASRSCRRGSADSDFVTDKSTFSANRPAAYENGSRHQLKDLLPLCSSASTSPSNAQYTAH
jgi:hypothetical protein